MKVKCLRINFLLTMVAVLVFGVQFNLMAQQTDSAADAGSQQLGAVSEKERLDYAPGRFIVKFKTDGPYALREDAAYLLESHQKFQTAVSDNSDSLDKLNEKYNIRKAKSVFIDRYGMTTDEAKQKQEQVRQLTGLMHQSRAQQAPPNTVLPDLSNVYLMEMSEGNDVEEVIEEYNADPHVEYVQPDYLIEAYAVPDSLPYSSPDAGEGLDVAKKGGFVVAVVDTGVDYKNPDIQAAVWTNQGEIADNGLDDDSNGYVDDAKGWNFDHNDNNPTDGGGQGTHVLTAIATIHDKDAGVTGVVSHAKIMPVKALSDNGLTYSSVLASAFYYAALNGADVIHNRWGCKGGCSSNPIVEDAVRTAYGFGVILILAADDEKRGGIKS